MTVATQASLAERIRDHFEAGQTELSRRYRAMVCQPPFQRYTGESVAQHREAVYQWCRHLAEQGYGKLGLPRDMGGDPLSLLPLVKALGLFDFSLMVKFGVHFGLNQGAIARLGTERHRAVLPGLASLETPCCFAMTETDHGSNVRGIETTAHYDPQRQEFEIHTPHPGARKDYIGSAALHGRLAITFANLHSGGECHGVHAFLVPLRDEQMQPMPGIHIEDCGPKVGLNGVDNGRIAFDHVRIPRENLLDRFGSVAPDGAYESPIPGQTRRFFTMVGNLIAGRITVAAGSLVGAQAGLAVAIRYALRRRQFGAAGKPELPILDYQSHQRRLMPRLAATFAVEAGVGHLVDRYGHLVHNGAEDRELETFAAALKAYGSWLAVDTLQTCRECCGGAGYLSENRFGALRNDLDIFTTFEGDNVVLSLLVARNLLNDFRLQFKGGNWLTGLKWLSRQVAESHRPRWTGASEEHLSAPEFLRDALRFRQEKLLTSLARRLRSRLHRGLDPFEAVNACQDHALSLARAYAETRLFECLAARADSAEPDVAAHLRRLLALFGVSRLEADRGWFLEQGYLDPARSKGLRRATLRLCGEVRQEAPLLVDSFGIPDELLGAPIAR
ncbi:MAG: acyl-CoA dehydrogenase [Candidatus Eremiobacterota bacterium]